MHGSSTLKRPFYAADRQPWFVLGLFVLCALTATAQPKPNSVEAYAKAIQQSTVAGQISAMEHYLAIAENGILKQDALEVLIWDYTRTGSAQRMKQRAQDLLRLDPRNPVAIAALEEQAPAPSQGKHETSEKAGKERIIALKAALVALESLRKPEGMQDGDFAALRRHVEAGLEGALGLAHVAREEYQEAKTPLQEALTSDPANAQYAYALGLALLLAKEPDPARSYFYLARAADLTRGTPEGQQIAEFGRKHYHKAGGSDADWNKFLAAAELPRSRQVITATATTSTTGPASASSGIPPAAASSGAPTTTAPNATPSAAASAANLPAPNTPPPLPSPTQVAALTPDAGRTAMKPPPPPVISSPNLPVSLAILVETALLTGHNRPMIVSALQDLVHRLRPGDEAALLVFSNQLDFEQDLTANSELLTEALAGLRPKAGDALLDGVAFAAGHLKRIGKNSLRVLLVVSDGRSAKAHPQSLPLSSQISGVRIDCIGLDVENEAGRLLLQNLAAGSGGHAMFVRGPEQFRVAAAQMTYGMGIALP